MGKHEFTGLSEAGGIDLQVLVERYFDAVTLIVDGKIRYANRALREMTGYSAEEALGRAVSDFIVPEDHQRVQRRIAALESGAEEHPSEYRLRRKDGSTRAVEITSRAIDYEGNKGLLSIVRDVTEHRRALARLRESEERYRVLYEDNPSMYFTVDRHGTVLSVNKFGAEQLGYEAPELLGQDVLQVFHPEDKQAVQRHLAECLKHDSRVDSWEFRKVRKDGAVIWVHERVRAVQGADGEPIVLIVCEDITEQRKAEEERRALDEQIRDAQKLESLGLMAGGIAHDFNNLLVGVLGNASLALAKLEAESPARSNLEQVQNASNRAAELCRQLLAYSGRGRFVIQPLDVSDLVRDLSGLLEFAVARKGIVCYELAPDLPSIEADAPQVRQVVMNLLTNASESIGDAAGAITIRTRVVDIDQDFKSPTVGRVARGRYVCLEVADTGCGMDDETLEKMFDPFFSTKFAGRGLGLAAVLGIVRGHAGAIEVTSEEGKGTIFRTLFPASGKAVEKAPVDASTEPRRERTATVLVIDDEEIVRSVAREALELAGFEVLTAVDGAEGVRTFHESGDAIDLVLLDITMPGMSSDDVLRELRDVRGDVKVVLSSGYDEQEIAGRFGGREPHGWIQKPYSADKLVDRVRRILDGPAAG